MRVGILSYPMLFQRDGSLQVQVRETVKALNRLPPLAGGAQLEAELVDPFRSRLDDYDVVHVFAAVNGNHRIVEAAVDLRVPVVLSALVAPGWNRSNGTRARIADRLLGNLIACDMQTSYAQTRHALHLASLIVAQGEAERQAIRSAFLISPAKVRVLPGGISPHFFDADGTLFRARTAIAGQFALMVGAVSPYKNQLGIAQALSEMALPFVVIGEALERDTDYLRQLRAVPGVICMGALHQQQRMLASAYAAASVFVMPSQGEGCPLAVLEALAAGTAVMMTADTALVLPNSEFALKKVRWDDSRAQKSALLALLEAPPARERVRALVRPFTWDSVALQLADCYADAIMLVRRADRAAGACAASGAPAGAGSAAA
ncbi:MAG: glycosyltransferase family 4 protein [Pseudomonadota bacterium]|nr:glycosyltransferase family 4 protein [Pseudomonadota bacterium]